MRTLLPSHPLRRGLNAAIKLRAGLSLRGECVSEEVPSQVFWSALSVYEGMFAPFSTGKRVCDLGCGPGYGPATLARAGAREVVAVDLDRRNVRYARRRYQQPGLSFIDADIEALPDAPPLGRGSFDLVTSSNAFEHLTDPDAALDGAARLLTEDGALLLAVPPITSSADAEVHADIRYHRTNITVQAWAEKLESRFASVQRWRHRSTRALDFSDPRPVDPIRDTFSFEPVAEGASTITAIFECR